MNNEIKEILDYLSNDSKSFIICGVSYYKISDYKAKVLLDYITNLQQENEYLKMNNPEQNMEHFKIINENKRKINNLREQNIDLKQENERLKINSGELQNAIDNIAELLDVPEGMSVEDVYDKVKDYKSRVEKAIEVINTQLKNAEGGYKDNLRIIKFNLIKGSCTFEDLKTEDDYKYDGGKDDL